MVRRTPHENFGEFLITEIKKSREPRNLVLTLHLFIEYWLDWLITKNFSEPDIILQDEATNDLRGFNNKLKILKAMGVMEDYLYRDIKIINRIRNLFAHTLDLQEREAREEFEKYIDELTSVRPLPPHMTPQNKLEIRAIDMILELSELYFSK